MSRHRHSRQLSSSRGRTASPAEEEAAPFQESEAEADEECSQEVHEDGEAEAEAEGGDHSEAASAARYLSWLEDRWQLRLSYPPSSSSSSSSRPSAAAAADLQPSAVQSVLQELLRAEERFIQAYGLAALQRDIGFFSQ